ncbi:MAG: hypothetical protein GXO90_10100 [FCB group bacterium]|nr:hypothetical protein [FCB group bacterium]
MVEKTITAKFLQPEIYSRLLRLIENDRVGSAYLFTGPRGCGKEALAIEFAGLVNGGLSDLRIQDRFRKLNHENLKLVFPLSAPKDSKTDDPLKHLKTSEMEWIEQAFIAKTRDPFHKIEFPGATRIILASIRELRKSLVLKSLTGGTKVVLVFDAHLLSLGGGTSANALLKILEEPPPDTVFVLVTDHKYELLPTILSRCQHIDFPPLEDRIIRELIHSENLEPDYEETIIRLARGDAHLARSLVRESPEEIETILKEVLTPLLKQNADQWRRFVDRYAQLARNDFPTFRFHFYLLRVWLNSQDLSRHGLRETALFRNLSTVLNDRYPQADFMRLDACIQELLSGPLQNLYMPLSLFNFIVTFQHVLQGKQPA